MCVSKGDKIGYRHGAARIDGKAAPQLGPRAAASAGAMPDEGTDADAIDPATKWWNRPIKPETGIGTHTLDVEILVAGDGYRFPKPGNVVAVQYVGYLPSGKVFDSTYRRGAAPAPKRDRRRTVPRGRFTLAAPRAGTPFKFKLGQNQVIEGLDTAISQLSAGERAKIRVGSERAFGKKGFPYLVPPSTPLVFDLEYLGSE